MHGKVLAVALAAGALALANPARAGDTIKLKLPARPTPDLHDLKATEADLRTETIDTSRYYRGWGWGGYRGWGGWGGSRVWVGGWRGGWGWGGYRGWGGWGGSRVWVGGWGRPVFWPTTFGYTFAPSYYSYSAFTPGFYNYAHAFPCSLGAGGVTTLTVRVGPSARPAPAAPVLPRPGQEKAPGTFPYDGGPQAPVPMPRGAERPGDEPPNRPATTDEVLVSMRAEDVSGSGKWAYPAYGEAPRRAVRKASSGFELLVYGRPAK